MTVKADVAPGVLADDKVSEMQALARPTPTSIPRVQRHLQGRGRGAEEGAGLPGKAFGVALFLMAIILVTQFNSFYSAFLILSAVVMSTSA